MSVCEALQYGPNNKTHRNACDIIPGFHNVLIFSLTLVTLACVALCIPLARLTNWLYFLCEVFSGNIILRDTDSSRIVRHGFRDYPRIIQTWTWRLVWNSVSEP
jgi:hypothetical protein